MESLDLYQRNTEHKVSSVSHANPVRFEPLAKLKCSCHQGLVHESVYPERAAAMGVNWCSSDFNGVMLICTG